VHWPSSANSQAWANDRTLKYTSSLREVSLDSTRRFAIIHNTRNTQQLGNALGRTTGFSLRSIRWIDGWRRNSSKREKKHGETAKRFLVTIRQTFIRSLARCVYASRGQLVKERTLARVGSERCDFMHPSQRDHLRARVRMASALMACAAPWSNVIRAHHGVRRGAHLISDVAGAGN